MEKDVHSKKIPKGGSAKRMRRFRTRRRRGVVHVVNVGVYDYDLEVMVQRNVITPGETTDRRRVSAAVENILTDWTNYG